MKDDDFRLLAGQTWDVISPLYPGMLMYSVGWDGGNIGYRRAQVRGERYFHFSDISLMTTQTLGQPRCVSGQHYERRRANRPIGRLSRDASHGPSAQRGPGCLPIIIGVSGHIGEKEFDVQRRSPDNRRRTWSGNFDVRVPLTERFGIQGECRSARTSAPFSAVLAKASTPPPSIPSATPAAGWRSGTTGHSRLHSHVGYSIDDPNDHDLHTVGDRSYNQFYFGNLCYDLTKNFLVGMEVSSWKTLYVGEQPGNSVRTEFVAKYGF